MSLSTPSFRYRPTRVAIFGKAKGRRRRIRTSPEILACRYDEDGCRTEVRREGRRFVVETELGRFGLVKTSFATERDAFEHFNSEE